MNRVRPRMSDVGSWITPHATPIIVVYEDCEGHIACSFEGTNWDVGDLRKHWIGREVRLYGAVLYESKDPHVVTIADIVTADPSSVVRWTGNRRDLPSMNNDYHFKNSDGRSGNGDSSWSAIVAACPEAEAWGTIDDVVWVPIHEQDSEFFKQCEILQEGVLKGVLYRRRAW